MKYFTNSRRLCAALLLTLLATLSAQAEYATIDGIRYYLNSYDKTARVESKSEKYSGNIIIPETVSYNKKTYKVTEIGIQAFEDCTGLTAIEIPNSVTSIGSSAFEGCTGLTSIEIPNSVTSIGSSAFEGCTGLTSIEIPNSVTSINDNVFQNCTGLTSLTIPNSVTSIGSNAFYGCVNLTNISVSPENEKYCSIDGVLYSKDKSQIIVCPAGKKGSVIIPNSITEIGADAFRDCSGLTSIEIPNSVTYIGEYAFSECTGLTQIVIQSSVTSIGKYAFNGCNLHPLKIMSVNPQIYISNKAFYGLNSKSDIVCSVFDYSKMRSLWSYNLYCYDSPYAGIKDLKGCIAGVSFGVNTDNPYYEAGNASPVLSAEVTDYSSTIGSLDNLSFDSSNIIKGLRINRDYNLHVYANLGDKKVELYNNQIKTLKPTMIVDYTSTQTTIKLKKITGSTDISTDTPIIKYETSTGGKKVYNGGSLTIKDLRPNKGYRVYAYYGIDNIYEIVKTKDISVSAQNLQSGPTTFNLEGSYNTGDAKLDKVEWLKDGEVVSTSQNFTATGLSPATDYNMAFRVTTVSKSGETYSKAYSKSFTTSALDLEILAPKNVSAKKSIVAAKTNISDEETSVGFQWKKYDAPASLPYSEAYAAVCDGQIEGVINNLQPTYYNVRAFYKDANGKYYYSDLMTFDPTDFSFFQPTVHTYPAAVSPNSVQLKGYALEGTDDIISQGFEYWVSGAAKSQRLNVAAASNINTVVAKGQRMTAELTDLKEGTEYTYRAFVETSAGRIYGDELSFTTPGMGAVDDIAADAPEVTVVAYYDLSGRRYSVPQNGFNIVVYSDGTTKKIFFKH